MKMRRSNHLSIFDIFGTGTHILGLHDLPLTVLTGPRNTCLGNLFVSRVKLYLLWWQGALLSRLVKVRRLFVESS